MKLLLNMLIAETPTCNINKNSGIGKILKSYQLITWDECTQLSKLILELARFDRDATAHFNVEN